MNKSIKIYGARTHNLKNISIEIPSKKLVVITGVSGSGKSSLAFETLYNEGKRRYIETFSSYARQFLGEVRRPDVDNITGLSPVIAIEQKTISKNPRSTVGTVTEIYDFLRLLFAKISTAYSYNTGEKMLQYSEGQVISSILEKYKGKEIIILAPLIKGRKGIYRELFNENLKKGFLLARVDGTILEIQKDLKLSRFKAHDIEIVIDELKVNLENKRRIEKAVSLAMNLSKGSVLIIDKKTSLSKLMSKHLMCPTSGISYEPPSPNSFSFNSPYGYCPSCKGIGKVSIFDLNKITENQEIAIIKGINQHLEKIVSSAFIKGVSLLHKNHNVAITTKTKNIPKELIQEILYGVSENGTSFYGLIKTIETYLEYEEGWRGKKLINQLYKKVTCKTCQGSRLKKEASYFKVANKDIYTISKMSLKSLYNWISNVNEKLTGNNQLIAQDIILEIKKRLEFIINVGLEYLCLNRVAKTLSGGEAQRIRLGSQIGSKLVNILYILDEPSIGLHPRDNHMLIDSLKELRDIGNSLIVVEHDKDIMLASDYIIDIGPKAGKLGGEIVAHSKPNDFIKNNTITAKYLNNEIVIPPVKKKGSSTSKKTITIKGMSGHNLKNISISFPLGKLICVTGVSGSGKSTIVNETLYPILSKYLYDSIKPPLSYSKVDGLENIDKIVSVDQAPIGRTPRSNPATYTKVFTDIRTLFANSPEAKIRGYNMGRFSFNVKGGRCEKCKGGGLQLIEMEFLQDVYVECSLCQGKRYNRETLEVRFKGKSINDVLNMNISEALVFFEAIPNIYNKIKTLEEVGLGYVTLGQSSTTLSGGEAQRVKLSSELSKKQTGKTFYILDEPSTGLHFEDINILIKVLKRLVKYGNTVLIIEHNLDIIKTADHIIDIGPYGGEKGGELVAQGSPYEVIKVKKSFTAQYLKKELTLS